MQRCDVKKKHTQDWWLCEPWRYKWKWKIKIKNSREMLFLCYPPTPPTPQPVPVALSPNVEITASSLSLLENHTGWLWVQAQGVKTNICPVLSVRLWVKTHKSLCCDAGGKQTLAQKVCWLQWWEWTLQSWFITDQIICYNVEAGVLFSSYPL